MKINADESIIGDAHLDEPQFNNKTYGLTKREYLAAKAMQGFISDPSMSDFTPTHIKETIGVDNEEKYNYMVHYPKYIALLAVAFADALIEQLNKSEQ